MPNESVSVDSGTGIHICTHFDEDACRFQITEFSGHMKQRCTDQRCKCRHHRRPVLDQGRIAAQFCGQTVGIVEENGTEPRIIELAAALEQQSQAFWKPV
jgi:hypothetical protein